MKNLAHKNHERASEKYIYEYVSLEYESAKENAY